MTNTNQIQFAEYIKKLEAYDGLHYHKVLSYNVNAYHLLSPNEGVAKPASIGFTTWIKKLLRNTLYTGQSRVILKHYASKHPVLFFISNYTHIREMVPLALHLKEKHAISYLFCTHKPNLYKLLTQTHKVIFLSEPLNAKTIVVNLKESDNISESVKGLIEQNYYSNLFWHNLALNGIRKLNPSIIINGNDLLPEQRILNDVAKSLRIPTLTMQHGSMSATLGAFMYSNSDYWSVYGAYAKEVLVNLGIPAYKVNVTGSNYIQSFVQGKERTSCFDHKLQLSEDEEYILVMFSGHGHSTSKQNYLQQLDAVWHLAKKNSTVKFIVKMHPKERIEDLQRLKLPNISVITHDTFTLLSIDILELLVYSKALISGLSATVYEAFLFNKPVFTLDFAGDYGAAELITQKLTIHCHEQTEFESAFNRFLVAPQSFDAILGRAKKFSSTYFYDDGINTATQHQAKKIMEIIEPSKMLNLL